jgi:hypothetical protein
VFVQFPGVATNSSAVVEDFSVLANSGFTLTNNTQEAFDVTNILFDVNFSSFLGGVASVTDPSAEYDSAFDCSHLNRAGASAAAGTPLIRTMERLTYCQVSHTRNPGAEAKMSGTEYRGYRVHIFRSCRCWNFSASPTTPFLPLMPQGIFVSNATTEALALEEAKGQIDRLLAG